LAFAGQKGEVLSDQLFLQVDGVGGDDDPLVVAHGPQDGRHQIGQGFAGAGAGLHQDDLVAVEGLGHGTGHAQLFVALLVALQVCHHAIGSEDRPISSRESSSPSAP